MASSTTIEIKGKVYSLSLPMSKVEMAEDLLGKSLLNIFNPQKKTGGNDEYEMPRLSELIKIFYVELLNKHPEFDLEKAGDVIDEYLEENSVYNLYVLVGRAANFFKKTPSVKELAEKVMGEKKSKASDN